MSSLLLAMLTRVVGQKYAIAEYESSKDNKLACYFGRYHKFGLVQRWSDVARVALKIDQVLFLYECRVES